MSDPTVIARIRRNFVPVALNLYTIRDAKGPGGDFFRSVQKQRPKQYQGLYVVTPEGKVLATQDRMLDPPKRWADAVLGMIAEATEATGPLAARLETPTTMPADRGVGRRKDGDMVLAVYARSMTLGLDRRGWGERAIDSVTLTASQAYYLSVKDRDAGTRWSMPASVVRKLHKVLSPNSDANTLATIDEVTAATMVGQVDRVAGGVAYLSFRGRIAGTHVWQFDPHKGKKIHAEVELHGLGTCEEKSGKLLSITLIGYGRYRNYPPYDEPEAYGAVVQWRAK